MKPRFVTTLGLAGALLAGSIAAVAQVPSGETAGDAPAARHHDKGRRHHGKGKGFAGRGGRFGHFGRDLGLTDAQKAQIKTIVEAERTKNASLHRQLRDNHRAMREASKAGQFDEAKVRELAQQTQAAKVELAVSRARIQSTIYNTVFTPEQRTKVDEFAAKRDARRAERAKGGDAK
jgi:periplasmic protein CpxP/Spy